MEKNKLISLKNQIRNEFGIRILITFVILFIIVIGFTVNDIYRGIFQLEDTLTRISKPLEEYIINQVLVDNYGAIEAKIKQVNKTTPFHLAWVAHGSSSYSKQLRYIVPFSWKYNYPLMKVDQQNFGYLIFSGSFSNQDSFISSLLIRNLLLLLFLAIGFALLLPLIFSIPNRLFLKPVMKILSLLENGTDSSILQLNPQGSNVDEIQKIERKLLALLHEAKESSKNQALYEITSQVAHDIRSPLSSLSTAIEHTKKLPENERAMIRSAVQRINDIANNLLRQHKKPHTQNSTRPNMQTYLLYPILDSIISEKRQVLPKHIVLNLYVSKNAYMACTNIFRIDFGRVISNLINNSIEAIERSGKVEVSLARKTRRISITIKDNGKGIAEKHLPLIFQQNVSFGKKDGIGLGLYHAQQYIEACGGTIKIDSREEKGTEVTIILPLATHPPQWLENRLVFTKDATIIVLDDDDSIHHVWTQRLNNAKKLIHFQKSGEFIAWWNNNNKAEDYFFLFDYELIDDTFSGLDLIEKFDLSKKATLVTSRYEEKELVERCLKSEIPLLPKNLSGYIPVIWLDKTPDYILIEDNDALRQAWEMDAIQSNNTLYCLERPSEFHRIMDIIAKNTPIYVDSDLGNGIKGELVAKDYFDYGFKNLYLTTGYTKEKFGEIPWIKEILGKDSPF